MSDDTSPAAHYVMIGGFLGAGKSTAVVELAQRARARGLKCGLITNDQSVGLVDTAMMRSAGFKLEEIAGGCFCFLFDSLVEAADKLGAEGETEDERPDLFIAEPVGSCTDLVATVSYPLRRIYGDRYHISPLSVMIDPVRAARILGVREGKSFSQKVVYVYLKQLEEADVIVINKADLMDAQLEADLRAALAERYPEAQVLTVSARHGEGLDGWLDLILDAASPERATMAIDYDTYAEGEALLGWLNATLKLDSDAAFDGETVMMDLAERIHKTLGGAEAGVAHLKMTLDPGTQEGHLAILNLVRDDFVPELSRSLPEQMRRGELIVNLRAEADPERLMEALAEALAYRRGVDATIKIELEHEEHFRPGRPTPTWRMKDAEELTRHE
jgi:G3E family GTPase